ncbi:MAG: hypothetical protein IRD7MM_00630 [Candidatus Midichloria mitochondrii]|uniref:hypothetical protein n=1 Tax=Candidatus Midichloria mitochondrii TaxID=234827 RepID=UPI00031E2F3E|nr:hypothetical protein [Candidatus Midichloria mitochondrii]MDJ1256197.1 hypothetical protein [Candidatus Midichloria mitochondrii]MDJ1287871.1 hypothetical protein [Candidatus Midichloria mitochondrii]MDJ1298759.1 hypothetical protein [Candidatus Midichloria mitochondrii]MDJ1312913.1 hypothetical protein [Candidatus Midichloria mitochondrii]MDJ1583482.1 hypothetical protein [Candidatus Midichloria mitochondrii]
MEKIKNDSRASYASYRGFAGDLTREDFSAFAMFANTDVIGDKNIMLMNTIFILLGQK